MAFSINQAAILGRIVEMRETTARYYPLEFFVEVQNEYGEDKIDARIACRTTFEHQAELNHAVQTQSWVSVQGKLRTGGWIQVRAFSTLSKDQE